MCSPFRGLHQAQAATLSDTWGPGAQGQTAAWSEGTRVDFSAKKDGQRTGPASSQELSGLSQMSLKNITQTGKLYQPGGVRWGGRWEGGQEGGDVCIPTADSC